MSKQSISQAISVYIHIPWCVRKCPYCDFNSHALRDQLPEKKYVDCLLEDFTQELDKAPSQNYAIQTIFFGGGTPSLFSPESIQAILTGIDQLIPLNSDCEITLEANPGTVEQARFIGFRQAGINRLSLGIQSFNNEKLIRLGRIHDGMEAIKAIEAAKNAGFDNFNLDLMFGLPQQTLEDALEDLNTAIAQEPTHLSWYQLTLEPNTLFYRQPPVLPEDDLIWEMQEAGQHYLQQHGFLQYEISAYAKENYRCQHNLNYWTFGDYFGIGAGAHGKMTRADKTVERYWKVKHPKDYLQHPKGYSAERKTLDTAEIPLEFMMNLLRLNEKIPFTLFEERTGISIQHIEGPIYKALAQEFIQIQNNYLIVTELGRRYLNELLELFLPMSRGRGE